MTELKDYEKVSTSPNFQKSIDFLKVYFGCSICGTKKGLNYCHDYGVVLCKVCEEEMKREDAASKV